VGRLASRCSGGPRGPVCGGQRGRFRKFPQPANCASMRFIRELFVCCWATTVVFAFWTHRIGEALFCVLVLPLEIEWWFSAGDCRLVCDYVASVVGT
jgi:hypothetical protein